MMQEHDLLELAEFESQDTPVLSVYLPLERRGRPAEEYKLALRKLLAQGTEQGATPSDIERVERFFEHEFDRQGRSVACFSCEARKFWRTYSLLVPIETAVFVGRRPYVKPLSDLWDNYERFAVMIVDREGARVLIYHLGALLDTAGTLGEEVKHHKQGGWAAQKLQRYEDQEARHNLKDAADWANAYLSSHQVKRLVLSGTDETLARLREQLPRPLAEKVVGQISLDMNATPGEVWEHAFEVAQHAQRRAEADMLEQVITLAHKGGAGALGLSATLSALQQGRVYQLLVDPGLHVAGQQCSNCRAVVIDNSEACPFCGGPLVATTDVINLAVNRAIDSGLKVSVLAASSRLSEIGGIAAVLRY